MSDTLEERLNRHSDSFQGLLSLIPAKYYFDEETQNQWNRKKSSKGDKREAKKAKLDPLNGSSAADEAKRRAEMAALEESDSDVSVIYDDNGNEIRLKPEEDDLSEDEPTDTPAKQEPKAQVNADKGEKVAKQDPKTQAKAAKGDKKSQVKPDPKSQTKAAPKAAVKPNKPTKAKAGVAAEPTKEAGSSEDETAATAKAAGINELRNKLQARINQLREKRKAPGTSAPGAPKSREELLAVRKQKLEQKKSQKRKRGDDKEQGENAAVAVDSESADAADTGDASDIIFGGVSFKDGQKVGKDLSLAVDKKIKKRTIQDQLKVLEQRKSKLEDLDETKRQDIEEKAKWSRMILQSEGAKLKDNEKLLKKALKQKKNKKLKSELQWNERKQKVAEDIAAREAKRNRNIANHTVIKHTKGKNQKKKLRQRAGFEGKKRRKN